MENDIKKGRSVKDIIISLTFILGGTALLFTKSDSMFILGVTLIAFGLILFLTLRSSFRITGMEGSYKRATRSYPRTKKDALFSFLNGDSEKTLQEAPGGLMMYIYYKSDKSTGFAQVNDYDQYEYKPLTGLVDLSTKQIKALVG